MNFLRNLDYEFFNGNISFSYCSMGPYYDENPEIINGILCNLPDFVPAGEYTKLESKGFDSNPNNMFSLNFPNDFNKSENFIEKQSRPIYNEEENSISKSKIIRLVLGILL